MALGMTSLTSTAVWMFASRDRASTDPIGNEGDGVRMSTVGAVVVSFNRRDLLRRVLEHITQQTATVAEILVVDNGSTDGTAEMVESLFPQATLLISEKNLGGAGGFARGMALALQHGHDYVWVMDDDAIPSFDCLELLLKAMQVDPSLNFVAPRVLGARRSYRSTKLSDAGYIFSSCHLRLRCAWNLPDNHGKLRRPPVPFVRDRCG